MRRFPIISHVPTLYDVIVYVGWNTKRHNIRKHTVNESKLIILSNFFFFLEE